MALGHTLAKVLPRAPLGVLRRVRVGPPEQVEGQLLDAHARIVLAAAEVVKENEPWRLGPEAARAEARHTMPLLAGRGPRMARVRDIQIPGPGGPLDARVYRPPRIDHPAPALVYFHGGGWVLGDIDTHDAPCRLLAREGNCVVISVDYRLAPEHPFPAPVEDAVAAYRWVRARAESLGLDPERIGVGGDSAGGNLAAVVSQTARDEGFPAPRFALLIYPAMEVARSMPSHRTFAEGYLLTQRHMDWFLDQYMPPGTDIENPRISPYCVAEVDGLCAAHVVTAGYDPLRDEAEAYAARLANAGIDCTVQRYPSMIHGFMNMIGSVPQARAAAEETGKALRRGLSR